MVAANPGVQPAPMEDSAGADQAHTKHPFLVALGERVRTLSADVTGMATWDAKNENGNGVASGVYFVFASKSGGGTKIYKVAVQR